MRLTVGQIIGKALKAYGAPYVPGLPGHGNWSMIDAFNDPISKLPSYRSCTSKVRFTLPTPTIA
jgi:hypothetical protein